MSKKQENEEVDAVEVIQEETQLMVAKPVSADVSALGSFFSRSGGVDIDTLVSIPNQNWDDKPQLAGVYLGRRSELFSNERYNEPVALHVVQEVRPEYDVKGNAVGLVYGPVMGVPETASLDVLNQAKRGNPVFIEFLGMKKGTNGNYRQFSVQIQKEVVLKV